MSKVHYRLSPSAAYRWSACPGSLTLSEGETSESSVYAEEGTRAHELAEEMAALYFATGEIVAPANADPEMVGPVTKYVETIKSLIESAEADGAILIGYGLETQLVHPHNDQFGGTLDCYFVLLRPDGTLHVWIVDYKHGTGVVVEAEGNLQLLAYATLLNARLAEKISFFGGCIVQPRAEQTRDGGVRFSRFTPEDILAFEQLAVNIHRLDDLLPGDHCRWCPARAKCPALQEKARKLLSFVPPSADEQPAFWVEMLELAPAIKSMLDEIPKKMIEAIRFGAEFPGYKVVESIGHRAWAFPDEQVIRALKKYGLAKKACLTEPALKSPAQVEKLLTDKEVLEALVERPKRGYTIAKASDRRPAVIITAPPAEESADVGEF